MLLFMIIVGAIPATALIFALGWKAGLLNRITIEPTRTAASTDSERITR